MGECTICEGDDHLPNRCGYCKRVFCQEHRLPEAHDCPGLGVEAAKTKRFESAFGPDVHAESGWMTEDQPYEVLEPGTTGTTPDAEYEGSPDLNPDGSLANAGDEREPDEADRGGGLLRRVLSKLF